MMVVGPVMGYLGGSWLETKIGGEPWLSFAGMVLGFVASIRQVIIILKRGEESGPSQD
jgi:F0F1-type ATP synthase assembly protein I